MLEARTAFEAFEWKQNQTEKEKNHSLCSNLHLHTAIEWILCCGIMNSSKFTSQIYFNLHYIY